MIEHLSTTRVAPGTFLGWTILSLCLSLSITFNTWAATFAIGETGSLNLSGEIRPGDAERAVQTILAIAPIARNIYLLPQTLTINSSGGEISEAIRIASLVKAAHMDVQVLSRGRGVCASSCFLVYLAGQERNASGIDTIKREGANNTLGPVGVHRPYFQTTVGGPGATKKQEDLMATMTVFLQQARVPQNLIDKMMSSPSNDIYWLNSEELQLLGAYTPGVEEELIAKCNYSAKRQRQMNAREYISDSENGVQACVRKYMQNTYGPIRDMVFERMRAGWRPWNG